uniref:(northern house mosquito) hypothetical protein n=1 Tax=Culex pipiens TaxID=7175 RepID=A0A8D8BB44_CULPI
MHWKWAVQRMQGLYRFQQVNRSVRRVKFQLDSLRLVEHGAIVVHLSEAHFCRVVASFAGGPQRPHLGYQRGRLQLFDLVLEDNFRAQHPGIIEQLVYLAVLDHLQTAHRDATINHPVQ